MPAADDGTKSSDELLDDELEETPWLSARNGPPTPRKQPTSVVTSQGAVDGTYKRSHNHRNTNDGYGGAKKRRCIQDPLTPSSSPQWRQRYVTPERTSKPTHLEDSPLSPRWERARKALCSPSLRREQEEAAREILEKAHSTVGLNASARDKATRAKMHGFECPCCTPYYDALGLSAEERRERVNQVSRHRGFQERPRTPDGYWDIHFPTIEEQIARGLFVVGVLFACPLGVAYDRQSSYNRTDIYPSRFEIILPSEAKNLNGVSTK
ncbi:Retinoblastoma-binding protein 8 [Aphelenchoides avenae]|nr:Retinoblastoma-binding protein 8 [Aphelenchus avenae]